MDEPRELRPDARHGREDVRVVLAAQPLQQAELARRHELRDRARKRAADGRERAQALEVALCEDLARRTIELAQRPGRTAPGAHAEGIRVVVLESHGDLFELLGQPLVVAPSRVCIVPLHTSSIEHGARGLNSSSGVDAPAACGTARDALVRMDGPQRRGRD